MSKRTTSSMEKLLIVGLVLSLSFFLLFLPFLPLPPLFEPEPEPLDLCLPVLACEPASISCRFFKIFSDC